MRSFANDLGTRGKVQSPEFIFVFKYVFDYTHSSKLKAHSDELLAAVVEGCVVENEKMFYLCGNATVCCC